MSGPRLLNVPLFPAPQTPQDYLLKTGTFDLELLHLPRDTQLHKDRRFRELFKTMTLFVESQIDRYCPQPWDFHSGHRGWLCDEDTLGTIPVHVIILHYPSLESERRFKDPNLAHKGMFLYGDHPERLYQDRYLDVLADLATYGVQRESIHFRLKVWRPHRSSTIPKSSSCCTIL